MVLLEAGCGVGNCLFPLLEEDVNIFAYACDFSPRAVDYVKVGAAYIILLFLSLARLSNSNPFIAPSSYDHHACHFLLNVCMERNILIQSKARKILHSAFVLHPYQLLYRFVSDCLHL